MFLFFRHEQSRELRGRRRDKWSWPLYFRASIVFPFTTVHRVGRLICRRLFLCSAVACDGFRMLNWRKLSEWLFLILSWAVTQVLAFLERCLDASTVKRISRSADIWGLALRYWWYWCIGTGAKRLPWFCLVIYVSKRWRNFLFENVGKSPEAMTVENGKTYNHIYHYCLIVFVLNSQFLNLQQIF